MRPTAAGQASAGRLIDVAVTAVDTHRVITWTAAVGLATTAVLALAGLPAANLHGPLHFLGLMDPLCGMTRGMFYTGHGQWATAWRYNPGSLLLAAGAIAAILRAGVGAFTGRWLQVRPTRPLLYAAILTSVVVLEINQQAHAALLMQR